MNALTAGYHGLVHRVVINNARHDEVIGNIDSQEAGDVVEPVRERRHLGPHRPGWGLLGVVDEPVDRRYGITAGAVAQEHLLITSHRFFPLQLRGAEIGCKCGCRIYI